MENMLNPLMKIHLFLMLAKLKEHQFGSLKEEDAAAGEVYSELVT